MRFLGERVNEKIKQNKKKLKEIESKSTKESYFQRLSRALDFCSVCVFNWIQSTEQLKERERERERTKRVRIKLLKVFSFQVRVRKTPLKLVSFYLLFSLPPLELTDSLSLSIYRFIHRSIRPSIHLGKSQVYKRTPKLLSMIGADQRPEKIHSILNVSTKKLFLFCISTFDHVSFVFRDKNIFFILFWSFIMLLFLLCYSFSLLFDWIENILLGLSILFIFFFLQQLRWISVHMGEREREWCSLVSHNHQQQ